MPSSRPPGSPRTPAGGGPPTPPPSGPPATPPTPSSPAPVPAPGPRGSRTWRRGTVLTAAVGVVLIVGAAIGGAIGIGRTRDKEAAQDRDTSKSQGVDPTVDPNSQGGSGLDDPTPTISPSAIPTPTVVASPVTPDAASTGVTLLPDSAAVAFPGGKSGKAVLSSKDKSQIVIHMMNGGADGTAADANDVVEVSANVTFNAGARTMTVAVSAQPFGHPGMETHVPATLNDDKLRLNDLQAYRYADDGELTEDNNLAEAKAHVPSGVTTASSKQPQKGTITFDVDPANFEKDGVGTYAVVVRFDMMDTAPGDANRLVSQGTSPAYEARINIAVGKGLTNDMVASLSGTLGANVAPASQ